LIVCNETGEETIVELTKYNGVENSSEEFVIKTGKKPGTYTWDALLAHVGSKGSHGYQETAFSFDFLPPHTVGLQVWGVPLTYVDQEKVSFNVGAQCMSFCSLAGAPIYVHDSQDVKVGEGVLGEELWPSTDALYWTRLSIPAPSEPGEYEYTVQLEVPPEPEEEQPTEEQEADQPTGQQEAEGEEQAFLAASTVAQVFDKQSQDQADGQLVDSADVNLQDQTEDKPKDQSDSMVNGQDGSSADGQPDELADGLPEGELAESADEKSGEESEEDAYNEYEDWEPEGPLHVSIATTFTLRVHRKPDHMVTVKVYDAETKEPVEGASVRIPPERVLTDSTGTAVVPSKAGTVTVFAQTLNYIGNQKEITVTEDTELSIGIMPKMEID